MILPAILSTVPSALSRDPDLMACRPFHGQSAAWLMANAVLPVCGGQYPASVYPQGIASTAVSHRVERIVGYSRISELSELQRREFHETLLDADSFEDLPGKWQVAILAAEENRPKLPLISRD